MSYKRHEERVDEALAFLGQGNVDGAHHKDWIIDQLLRILVGSEEDYEKWVKDFCDGEDGPETYAWDEGVAP